MENLDLWRRWSSLIIKVICLCYPMVFARGLAAQQQQAVSLNFTEIDTKGQLPSSEVSVMYMDRTGYLWIGTYEGLVRYDGHHFQPFLHDPEDSTSISNDNIHDIIEDENGFLWVTTRGGGLNRFDPVAETFKRFLHDPDDPGSISGNECNRLFIDSDHNLWISTFAAGFNKYLPKTQSFLRIPIDTTYQSLRAAEAINSAYQIIEDVADDNILWVSGHPHLIEFHKDTKKLIFHPHFDGIRTTFIGLVMTDPASIWLGSWAGGLSRFNPKTQTWATFSTAVLKEEKHRSVRQVKIKNQHELWLSDGAIGLAIFNTRTKKLFCLPNFSKNTKNIGNWIRIAHDRQGRLWVANRSGIRVLDPAHQKLKFKPLQSSNSTELEFPFSTCDFVKDKQGNLYVAGKFSDGIFQLDSNHDRVKILNISLPPDPASKAYMIPDLMVDSRERLWAIDYKLRTVLKYNPENESFEPFQKEKFQSLPFANMVPSSLLEDRKGNIWIGASYGGLIKWEESGDTLIQYVSSTPDLPGMDIRQEIMAIRLDEGRNCLWIASGISGVFQFSLIENRYVRHYPQTPKENAILPEGKPQDIEIDRLGRIWVANFGHGVQVIDPELPMEESVTTYSKSSGLPSNNVMYIEKDANDDMWLYSFEGLTRYDMQSHTFKTYSAEDGLQDPRADGRYGLTALSDGTMYVGQKEGFHYFHIDSLPINTVAPPIVFSWFKVFEEERNFEKSLNHLEEIRLPYTENFFSIGFAALNFAKPHNNQYAYQLEGFDEQMIDAGHRNFASYTNVPEGHYTFRVIGANNDQVWNEEGARIDIIILPPWYRTPWAYLAYLLLAGLFFYGIYRIQKRRWQLQTQLQLEQQEAVRLKELDEVKSRLYTNITHEFRTPLTVIKGVSDEIREDVKNKVLIQRNADHLLHLINQMLDLSKIESGNMPVDLRQQDIVAYLKYVTFSFQSTAAAKQISLSFYASEDRLIMDYDQEKVRQLLSNLLSNALKFTPEYGKVGVHVEKKQGQLSIEVTDTGIGIDEADLPYVFDRFRQLDDSATRRSEGTGIGLALVRELVQLMNGRIEVDSEKDRGATFRILLPITNQAPLAPIEEPRMISSSVSVAEPVISSRAIENSGLARLLIIEDNRDIVQYLRSLLRGRYRLSLAYNGLEGIKKAIEEVPDIILCDVMMPEKDGYEVCSTLKKDHRTSHIPIVILTAKGDQQSKEAGLQTGADAYLIKPFEKNELFIRLEQLIALRDRLRARYRLLDNGTISEEDLARDPEWQFLQNLEEVVKENLANDHFKIDPDLCRAMTMSRPQLYRKLKALKGISPVEYIRQCRLKKARQLLLTTNWKISEVAAEVGIQDPSYFSRIYTEVYQESPSATRKR